MKKVLIGLLNCNFEKYLDKSIQSALEQSYPCDIFITDDGSTDSSREIIKKHNSIRVHRMFHYDTSGDELRGMEEVIWFSRNYDYVYILSGDDILYKDAIDILLECAEVRGGDWIYGGLDVITSEGELLARWTYDGFPESVEKAIAYMWINRKLGTTLGSLFSTNFIKDKKMSRFTNTSFSLDASTAIDWYAAHPAPNICRVKRQVLKYRIHTESRSSTLGSERGQMQKDLAEKLLLVFGEEYIKECLEGK